MKIICRKEDLLYGVQTASRAVSSKNELPILSGIYLKAENNSLTFKATDQEIAIEVSVFCEVEEAGEIVVPGRYFNDLVKILSDVPIILESYQPEQLIVKDNSSETLIRCLDPADFPAMPQNTSGEISGKISAKALRKLIKQVSIGISNDEVRQIFSGILVEIEKNQVNMIATDTHRLALGSAVFAGDGQGMVILPSRTMQEVLRMLAGVEELIEIIINKNQVYFKILNIILTTRIISGQYPPYRQVLPAQNLFKNNIVINRQKMLAALEKGLLLNREASRNKTSIMTLKFSENNLNLSAVVPDIGRTKDDFAINLEGEEMQSSYNARYLADALKVIDEDEILMKMTGPTTPAIIEPLVDEEGISNFLYLILPVRTIN
ncbi:MAG: DNA polymerase III subunit beta [Clostridia bacterium]|nr:DNA polymerase III subunit beta [Clostridia bacterium]